MGEKIIEEQPGDINSPKQEAGITLSLTAQGIFSVKKMLEQEQWYTSLDNEQFKLLIEQLDKIDNFIVSHEIDVNSVPHSKHTLHMSGSMQPILSQCLAFSIQTGAIRLTSEVRALVSGLKILK